ncbi:MAG: hypothetical protein QOJ98_2608 [Acidobacteriota bacterium]|jgi:hypothetical protein|nr:hypothetical protein [Acidobacteriota bacterium]
MDAKEIIRTPDPRSNARVELREVIRDDRDLPRVFVRVKVSGYYFPERAEAPFVLVGDAVSKFALIEPGGLAICGYFDRSVPPAKRVTVGYGRTVFVDFDLEVDSETMPRLDRAKLPGNVFDSLA